MAKKKTSVMLPGSLQGLVHNLQKGMPAGINQAADEVQQHDMVREQEPTYENRGRRSEDAAATDTAVRPTETAAASTETVSTNVTAAGEASAAATDKTATATEKHEQQSAHNYKLNDAEEDESWELFLDLAKQYKKSDAKLATIYIDPDLKSVLDRLKYTGSERLSTSAILSGIVARFIYQHEEEIRKAIFDSKLI